MQQCTWFIGAGTLKSSYSNDPDGYIIDSMNTCNDIHDYKLKSLNCDVVDLTCIGWKTMHGFDCELIRGGME